MNDVQSIAERLLIALPQSIRGVRRGEVMVEARPPTQLNVERASLEPRPLAFIP